MAITINGLGSPQLDLPKNTVVNLSSTVTGSTYLWELLDKPENSTALLSSSFIQTPTITPDVAGTYTLKLTVDSNAPVYGAFAVKLTRSDQRVPAAGEDDPNGVGVVETPRGWASPLNRILRYYDKYVNRGSIETCLNDSGGVVTKGSAVYISGVQTLDSGLPEEEDIPKVSLASASTPTLLGAVGVVLGGINDETSINNGELLRVVFYGLVDGINTSGQSVNDEVYVTDTPGLLGFSTGTNSFIVGRVVEVSATGTIMVYPSGGGSGSSGDSGVRQRAVIDLVDPTAAPPTEVLGDRYILDFDVGTVHADWDEALKGDIVQYNGTIWEPTTPSEGWTAYVDLQNADALYIDDGTPAWELRNTYVIKVGTPEDNQIGVWTGNGTLEGDPDFTFDKLTHILQIENDTQGEFSAIDVKMSNTDAIVGNGFNQFATVSAVAESSTTPGQVGSAAIRHYPFNYGTTSSPTFEQLFRNHSVLASFGVSDGMFVYSSFQDPVAPGDGRLRGNKHTGFILGAAAYDSAQGAGYYANSVMDLWGSGSPDYAFGLYMAENAHNRTKHSDTRLHMHNVLASDVMQRFSNKNSIGGGAPTVDPTSTQGYKTGILADQTVVFHNYAATDMVWYANNAEFMRWDQDALTHVLSGQIASLEKSIDSNCTLRSQNTNVGTSAFAAVGSVAQTASCSLDASSDARTGSVFGENLAGSSALFGDGCSRFLIGSINLSPVYLGSNSAKALTIDTSQNIKVENAQLQIGSSTTAGFVLTADVNGVGTWQAVGGGDVFKVGTPVNNQIGVWTGDGTLEGDPDFTWDGSTLSVAGGLTPLSIARNNLAAQDNIWNFVISEDPAGTGAFSAARSLGILPITSSADFTISTTTAPTDPDFIIKSSGKVGINKVGLTDVSTFSEFLEVNGAINIGAASGTANGTIQYTGSDIQGRIGGAWLSLSKQGNVTKVGTPVNDQIGVWTGDGTLEGDTNFQWNGTSVVLNAAGSGEPIGLRCRKRGAGLAEISLYPEGGTNTEQSFHVIPKGTGGTFRTTSFTLWNTDFIASSSNYEAFAFGNKVSPKETFMNTTAVGSGTVMPIHISTGTNDNQLYLPNDGRVGVGTNAPSQKFEVKGNSGSIFSQNTETKVASVNTNAGTAALATVEAEAESAFGSIIAGSDARTGTLFGQNLAGAVVISGTAGNRVLIGADHNAPVYFGSNNIATHYINSTQHWEPLRRVLGKLGGSTVASASAITLGADGNLFEVTGTTTINSISTTDWTEGSRISLHFASALTVNDHATSAGNIKFDNGADYSATADTIKSFILRDGFWYEN